MQKDLQFLLYTTPSEDIKINAVIYYNIFDAKKAMIPLIVGTSVLCVGILGVSSILKKSSKSVTTFEKWCYIVSLQKQKETI